MTSRIQQGQLKVDSKLHAFIETQVLAELNLDSGKFWADFEAIVTDLQPINKQLLAKREALQAQIDKYHQQNGLPEFAQYKQFLTDIGYLQPKPAPFQITTQNVDTEITVQAGPQLVVPIMNARFALNAANARWGSLYDALYGTDVISEEDGAGKGQSYNPVRGQKVIDYGRELLDSSVPLANGSWKQATAISAGSELTVTLEGGNTTTLNEIEKYVGYQGDATAPTSVLLKNNQLHLDIQIDAEHHIGKDDPANIKDIVLEAALSTIMDCEDSVAAVDAEDKTLVYSNWLGLMKGDLSETVSKGGQSFERTMNADRQYTAANGEDLSLHGRSLLFVRNVGHLMSNPAILVGEQDEEIQEGLMDGVLTSAIAMFNLRNQSSRTNSREGSVYIVKPKMHGPEEVAFANTLFNRVEDMLGLERNTLKIGIMDEERRTSVNLAACIEAAKERVVFINTGFLDRTGDEIHTSMQAGAFEPKAKLKTMPWIQAYETANVATGLEFGLSGKAQIGKGMWPVPDNMADMMEAKIGHPKSGANTAWVPSPTAATLHALHYHQVNVPSLQQELNGKIESDIDTILQVPVMADAGSLTKEDIQRELENNAQGILGYVVRWVDQGVGCSKVPDINDVGLMEDRATCRISSQHMTNWMHHGLCSEQDIIDVMQKMAVVVDGQNANDPVYEPMAPNFDQSIAFQAALDLVVKGKEQPSGYTEPLLHQGRLAKKAL